MLQNAPSRAGGIGYALLFVLALLSSCNDRTNPGPGVAPVLRLKKVSYTQNQFQEFTYNHQALSRFRSQLDLKDEDGQYMNFTVDFHYGNQQQLDRLTFEAGGGPVKYSYEGNVLKKTEEYDHKGRLVVTHHYTFGTDNRLHEVKDVINDLESQSQPQLKRTYEYDARGNLTVMREYKLNAGNQTFVQTSFTTFEGYDDKKNPELALEVYPFVQNLRLRVNNPAKKTLTETLDGNRVTWIEEHTYEYNTEGYPLKKVTKITVPGADPAPLRIASYEYQQ